MLDSASRDTTLLEKVRQFAASNTVSVPSERDANTGLLDEKVPMKSGVTLLTHLTYFGYCFNPVSFYFIFREGTPDSTTTTTTTTGISGVHTIVTEVSNTPWNEQHRFNISLVAVYRTYCQYYNSTILRMHYPRDVIISTTNIFYFKTYLQLRVERPCEATGGLDRR